MNGRPTPRGTVVVRHSDGRPLAWSSDPPHIRLYACFLSNLHPGRDLPVDRKKAAKDTGLTTGEVLEAMTRLVREGDLKAVRDRRQELFRLVIRYE